MTKKLQPFQAYSKLYHKEKLKTILDEKFKEHQQTVTPTERKSRFAFTNGLTKEMYEEETDEVKAEVEHYQKRLADGKVIKLEDNDEDDEPVDDDEQEKMNQQMQL